MLYRYLSMQTKAYIRINVATCRDVPKLHLLKQHFPSSIHVCIMKKYVHAISCMYTIFVKFSRKIIIEISMFKFLNVYRC